MNENQVGLTIRAVAARAVLVPLARPITTAHAVIPAAPLVLIDLETEQGVTGRAYIFAYTPLALKPLVAMLDNLAALLKGQQVAPRDRLADMESQFRLLGRQGLLGMALGGLDMAMWDALGRALDRPVAELLGGSVRPIPAYDSQGVFVAGRDEGAIEQARDQGFSALKVKIGGSHPTDDVANLTAIRDLIGPDMGLMIDYNQSLTVPEAIRRARRLAPFDLTWIEEPVAAEDLAGHAQVRAQGGVAIQTGENWWFPEDAARAIQAGASDFAMLDLVKIGGITGWMRAAAMAEGASLPVSSHLFAEASAHVLAATTGAHFLEYLDVAGEILADPPVIENGCLTPRGPGLGMAWDEAAVSRCRA